MQADRTTNGGIKNLTENNTIKRKKITISKRECCELLGVSNPKLNKLIKEGGLPCKKFGRTYLFYTAEVIEWLKRP